MDQVKIGAFLGALRKEKGMTQEQLGERLGVSQRTVSRWETGKNMPDISMLPVICRELDVNIAELMNGERIEGEQLTKTDATRLTEKLIELTKQKKTFLRLLGAAISLVLTIVCMVGLYNYEFHIRVESTADLETAINEYHFNEEMKADVLERVAIGSQLFVLYGQNGHPTACGVCALERGIFGRYRMVRATNYNFPLCNTKKVRVGRQDYLLTFCVNDLPEVVSYSYPVYTLETGETGREFTFAFADAPFLQVMELPKDTTVNSFEARYFDAAGREIPRNTLWDTFETDETASHSGYGTAELGLVYAFEGIILLLGLVFIRYFLTEEAPKRKGE